MPYSFQVPRQPLQTESISTQERTREIRPLPSAIELHKWATHQLAIRGGDKEVAFDGRDQRAWEFLNNFEDHVLFEDNDLLAINKPAGIASHYSERNRVGIVEVVRYLRGWDTVALAHRLDRDTSGVLLLSKSLPGYDGLVKQFANKEESEMQKTYVALLDGEFKPDEAVVKVEALIARTETERMRIITPEQKDTLPEENVKDSLTFFHPLAVLTNQIGEKRTLTEVQIVTGRTHQIRVVAADYLGHPIIGDYMYNPKRSEAKRQMLHAMKLKFTHPTKDEEMIVRAPLADDFKRMLSGMKWEHILSMDDIQPII